jgi:hypothetical protein
VCTPVVAIEEALNIEVATPETSTS